MNFIASYIDFFVHLDKYLNVIVQNCGLWAYVVFFLVIFAETGMVMTPFLPGDSLLFGLGIFTAADSLNIWILFVILSVAAILGDSVNYAIGKYVGSILLTKKIPFMKEEYVRKTEEFYKRYGPKTIILARFVPIVRTFAPFVAGIGRMNYPRFLIYNIVGGILWVAAFLFSGFYLGELKWVKENFGIAIAIVIIISILPAVFEFLRRKSSRAG